MLRKILAAIALTAALITGAKADMLDHVKIPPQAATTIRNHCHEAWSDNYSMMLVCYKNQIEAFRALYPQESVFPPVQPVPPQKE